MSHRHFRKVFIFLDTEKHASSFAILTIIDVFPEAHVLKYESVTADDAERIVYDAMFPRGPEGVRHTKILINGYDLERVNEILERVKKCMFPPFEVAVIVDPRGAYTTASAAVGKVLEIALQKGWRNLENKTVAVLAGTGPVGQTLARLFASEKAEVIVTSRSLHKVSSVMKKINQEIGGEKVRGVEAQTPEDVGRTVQIADIVVSAGASGTQLLSLETLRQFGRRCGVVVDVNAIPPLGVEGLEPDADGKEILPRILGIGALAVGRLKNKIETELVRKAAEAPRGIFDHRIAYEIAKSQIFRKSAVRKPSKIEPQKHWLP